MQRRATLVTGVTVVDDRCRERPQLSREARSLRNQTPSAFLGFLVAGHGRDVALSVLIAIAGCTHAYTPTSRYAVVTSTSLVIRVAPELAGRATTVQVIETAVTDFERRAPSRVVELLRGVVVWVEASSHDGALAGYHGADWVRRHERNPDKADAVEIADVDAFVRKLETNPLAMFHELAHAYLARMPTLQRAAAVAYQRAVESRRYLAVRTRAGTTQRAYALDSPSEYFATLTEAYFGHSGEQPFDRAELATFDPLGYQLVAQAWSDPPSR